MFKINILILTLLLSFASYSQTQKVYNGETINVTDAANKKQGKWVLFDKAGKKTEEGNYLNNRKDGIWKGYYPSGKLKHKITYAGNRPNGPATFYYEDGTISEQGIWKINKWVGEYKYYHENGNLAYDWKYNKSGKRTGEQKYYYDDGSLMIKGDWTDGKKEGTLKEFHRDGSVKSEMQFVEGKINVSSIKEYAISEKPSTKVVAPKTQTVKRKTTKKKGSIGIFDGTGFYKTYNEYKKVDREGDFVNGKLVNGKRYFYDDTGTLLKVIVYKKGKITQVIDKTEEE